jgi:hypothetical protein
MIHMDAVNADIAGANICPCSRKTPAFGACTAGEACTPDTLHVHD